MCLLHPFAKVLHLSLVEQRYQNHRFTLWPIRPTLLLHHHFLADELQARCLFTFAMIIFNG